MRAGIVLLVRLIESGEEDERAGEMCLERGDGGLLISGRRHGFVVGLTRRRPARLRDDRVFAGVKGRYRLSLADDKLPCRVGARVWVEEGVTVDGAVTGLGAELGVVQMGLNRVDRHDPSGEAGALQLTLGGVHRADDSIGRSFPGEHQLVSNGDGIDGAPVAFDGINDGLDIAGDFAEIVDAGKHFHALGLGRREDGGDLIAAGFVYPDDAVANELLEIAVDLVLILAGAVVLVRGVCDAHREGAR